MNKTKWDDTKSMKSLICVIRNFSADQIKYDEIVILLVHYGEVGPYCGMPTHAIRAT